MLSVQDFKADPNYFATLADIAKGGLAVQSSTGTMMERVSSGENLIGFNILGSYAEARAKTDPSLGISYPKDYTLVLSRVTFISQEAANSNAAKLWVNYVLSEQGQNILANKADILHSQRYRRQERHRWHDADVGQGVEADPGGRKPAGISGTCQTPGLHQTVAYRRREVMVELGPC